MTYNIVWTLNNERHHAINYVARRYGAEPTIEQVKPCKVKHR